MKYIALDIETEDMYLKDRGKIKARGTSCVFGRGRIIIVGTYDGKQKKSYDGNGGAYIRKLFLNPNVTIIGANIQYDAVWLILKHSINPKDVKCHFIDVSVVESLIDEYQKYDLDSLAIKYLNEHKGKSVLESICQRLGLHGDFREHLGDLWDKGYKQEIRDYVESDADQPWRIWEKQKPILEAQGLMRAFEMNMEMLPVTIFMKVRGAKFDFARWQENCVKAGEPYNQLKSDYDRNYGEVNINSPKQLAEQMDRFDVPYKCKINIKGWKVTGRKFKNATDLFDDEEVMRQKKALKDVFGGLQIVKDSERRKRLVLFVPKRYAARTTAQISAMGYEVSCNPCINKAFYTEFAGSYQIVADLVQYKQAKNIVDKFLGPKFGRFIVAIYKDGSRSPAFDDKGEFIAEGAVDFRLCCTFNVVGARQTGRLSAVTPNLQQCLAEGTGVLTPDGYVPIETLKVGDVIYNGNGDLTTVTNVWYKGIKDCVCTVSAKSQSAIITTPEHKFWNGTAWEEAEDLYATDVIETGTGCIPVQALADFSRNCGSTLHSQGDSALLDCQDSAGRGAKSDCISEPQKDCGGIHKRNLSKTVRGRVCVTGSASFERPLHEVQDFVQERSELSPDLSNGRAEGRATQSESCASSLQKERSDRETSTNIQGGVLGWSWIHNACETWYGWLPKSSYAQGGIRRGTWAGRRRPAKKLSRASHRYEPLEQQLGQLGLVYAKSTQEVTHAVAGRYKVYDIEVASSDHSFIANGFRVHNCPSKTVLFEKTDHAVDLAKMCRECFVAEKGHAFVKFDYSAQENRLAAHFAPGKNGERIRQMYRDDPFLDEHSYVTEVSGLAEQHGKKAGRKYAKNLRFGVGYGMQIPRMMTQFGWTQEFAEDLYKKVSEAAPWLFELMEQVQDVVIRRRYIKTLVGRRVHMRPGKDKDAYKFMNYLIQGSASDMTKLATVAVFAGMKHNWEIEHTTIDEMAITVHDEDDFDIDCFDVEKAVKRTMEIRNCMENTSGCDLPIISCPEIGTSWADGVEWEPSLGDCEDFVRRAYTAIHDGTFSAFKKRVAQYSSREEDDGLTFAQFCYNVDEEEAEENAENIA